MATVMNEKTIAIITEALNEVFAIYERNLMAQIDVKFDEAFDGADKVADAAEKFTEDRIREIATEEAENTVNGATVDISA
jgi:hypothetical protein